MGIIIPCDCALKVKVMGYIQLYWSCYKYCNTVLSIILGRVQLQSWWSITESCERNGGVTFQINIAAAVTVETSVPLLHWGTDTILEELKCF